MTYDVMGNIKTLKRDNNLGTYYYTGNRLSNVFGLAGSYVYDANGNATTDGRTGATLTYNYLNLPVTVIDENQGYNITYTYDGTGKKLKKGNTGSLDATDYVDGIQYNTNQYNSIIDFIQTEEGVAKNNGGNVFNYHYNLTDHLGNVRYTFDIYNGAVRDLQQDNYYVFV